MTRLGKYEIHEVIGKGGFGTVYRATDMALDREIALKVLHPALLVDTGFIQRFRQEARLAAKLDHPHIVPVYDLDENNGQVYLAMKYLPGGSLKDTLGREGAMKFERALSVLRQLASALDYAHSKGQGLIHRDIKPGNILWEDENNVRLSDFGFAKAMTADASSSYSISGGMVGTPAYMAPEIWRRKTISPATDVYSLGCVFYEMLTGQCLFTGDSPADIMTSHVLDGPSFPDTWPEGTPPGMTDVLTRVLANKPEERYPSCGAFADAVGAMNRVAREKGIEPRESTRLNGLQSEEEAPVEVELEQPVGEAEASASEAEELARLEAEECARREAEERERIAAEAKTRRETEERERVAAKEKTRHAATERKRMAAEDKARLELEEKRAYRERQKGQRLWVELSENLEMEFVRVPPGEFMMGSDQNNNEEPVHVVSLDQYWPGVYPVTNSQYAVFVKEAGRRVPSHWKNGSIPMGKGDHPVVNVSWGDAQAFCTWLSQKSGHKIGLITEAQWEKAARGTDGRKYPWGNRAPDKLLCNFMHEVGDTTAVGKYSPQGDSPYGCADMAGNVWEWCVDWYDEIYYAKSPQSNPVGPYIGDTRILRGGCWGYSESDVGACTRGRGAPDYTSSSIGFRCALTLP